MTNKYNLIQRLLLVVAAIIPAVLVIISAFVLYVIATVIEVFSFKFNVIISEQAMFFHPNQNYTVIS